MAAETFKSSDSSLGLVICDRSSFLMIRTCLAVSLWEGCFSPRRSTRPIAHSCFELSDKDIHSRFSGVLFNLFPSMWLTVAPSKCPSTKASETARWTRTFFLILLTMSAIVKYPFCATYGLTIFSRKKHFCGFPFLIKLAERANTFTRPRLEISAISSHPLMGFQTSSTSRCLP